MRFDGKNNKQRAKSLKIGELSGVTIPAVPGSVATMRKYASPSPRNQFETLAKSIFTEMIEGRVERDRLMQGLHSHMDTLWDANREAKDTEQVKQNVRDYANSLIELAKATSADELLGMAIDDEKRDEIEAMLRDPLNGKTLDERIKTVRSKLSKQFAYEDKLPLDTPEQVKAAAQALSPAGFRGKKVQIPADKLEAVKAKVRAAYRKAYPDLEVPKHLEKNDMSETTKVAELEKKLETATALAAMNDVEKAHYHTLDSDEKREQFLKFSPEEREATVDMMRAADETYMASNGNTLRKSALGADVFEMLKSQDQELVKMRNDQQVQTFVKVAQSDERKHLPGEDLAKAAALRAIDSLPAEVKKTLGEMLNAGNAALGKEFTVKASAHSSMATSQEKFDSLVKSHMTEHKVDIAKATEAVMATEEGQALYGEIA